MPYIDPGTDPEEIKKDQDQQAGQAVPQTASGGGVVGGGSQTAATSGTSQPYSGGFQNLNSYLTANANDTTGQQFANKVQGSVDTANQAQQDSQAGFKNLVDANTVKTNDAVNSQVAADPYAYLHPAGSTSNAPGALSSFQNELNAQYTGPQTFADSGSNYQKATGATQQAVDQTKAAQSEGGRFALLGNYFGNQSQGNYTQGQKSLDNLLVQNNPQTQQSLQQAAQNAQTAQTNLNQTTQSLNDYANQGNVSTQAAKTAAQNAVGIDPTTGQFGAGSFPMSTMASLQAQADQYNQANANAYNQKKQDLQNMSITSQYGVDPLHYLSQNPNQATVNNVATSDQANRIQALSDLAGMTNTYLTDPSQAGTFNPSAPGYNFNQSAYSGDLANAKAAWNLANPQYANTPTVAPGLPGYNPKPGNGNRF